MKALNRQDARDARIFGENLTPVRQPRKNGGGLSLGALGVLAVDSRRPQKARTS